MVTVVTACTQVGDFTLGQQIHLYIRWQWTRTDAMLSNTLIDLYFKCRSVDRALNVLSTKPGSPNLVWWNTVIADLG